MTTRQKLLQARELEKIYQEIHRETNTHPIKELKSGLKELGFDSISDFEKANKEYLSGPFIDEYIASLEDRQFRLLVSSDNPKYDQAVYEAVIELIQNGVSENTIISWQPDTFYIGIPRKSKIEVINRDKVERLGINYVRSLFSDGDIGFISSQTPIINILDKLIYNREVGNGICKRIQQRALSLLGIETSIIGNDLIVDNKKIGATAYQKYGDVNNFAVGVLLDLDLSLVDSIVYMKPSQSGRPGMLPSERLTTAKIVLGRKVPYSEYEQAFLIAISEILKISVVEKGLTEEEEVKVAQLMPKYESEQWTLTGK